MARLPNPGGDDGQWGDILNDYLSQEIKSDGTLKIRTDNTFANKTHASTHYPGGSDPLAYSLSGTIAARPTASATNAGLLYLATDENGGTTYRSNGTSWTQVAAPVTGGTATKATNLVGGNGTTLLGSIPYQSDTDTTTQLNPNTTSTKKFLRQTGTGTNGAAPAWDTIVAGDIPSLDALTAPAADLSINSHKLTNVTDPTNDQDGATKVYVDKNPMKQSVTVATTANITLSNTQTIDGIALSAGDRVLVKNQSTASANGIYTVVSGGAWTRGAGADVSSKVISGMSVYVQQGTINAQSTWVLTTTGTITLGTTSLSFSQLGSTAQVNGRKNPLPANNNLLAWNMDPVIMSGSMGATVTTRIYLTRINIPSDMTVSNIWFNNSGAGTVLSNAFVGLYSSNGTTLSLLASADASTALTSTGVHSLAITPVSLSGGSNVAVWAALYVGTMSTAPTLVGTAAGGAGANAGLTAGTDELRNCYISTSAGTTPAPATLNWSSAQVFFAPWVGLS